MADGRLHVARAGAGVPAQPVAHDDAARPVDGRAAVRARLLPSRSAGSRWRRRRSAGRSSTAAAARARGYGLEARLLDPAEVAELDAVAGSETILGGFHVADDGVAKAVRAAEALTGAAGGDACVRGDGADGPAGRGGPRHRRRDVGRDDRRRARGDRGGAVGTRRGEDAARARDPARARPASARLHRAAPELAGETREIVHPILRHQDHSMYFRQVGDAYAIGNYRHEPRLTEPEDRRGRRGAAVHRGGLRRARRGSRTAAARSAARRAVVRASTG